VSQNALLGCFRPANGARSVTGDSKGDASKRKVIAKGGGSGVTVWGPRGQTELEQKAIRGGPRLRWTNLPGEKKKGKNLEKR